MNANEATPAVLDPAIPTEAPADPHDAIRWEANRLMEFKKEKVKRGNQTPCPACATYVHINANKCPHCSSDIAANNALVRESLRRLDEIATQLEAQHGQHMERLHGAPRRPFAERVKSFFTDPQTKKDMKVVIPVGVLFFAAVGTLRALGYGTLFWGLSIVGGAIAYTVLVKLNVKRLVTIDLYRSVLVFGLLMLMASALAQPMSPPSIAWRGQVKVVASTANIRASNSTESSVVATVNEGDRLTVVQRSLGWYKVRTADGSEGWVHAALVRE
jgi:hypothetical protein